MHVTHNYTHALVTRENISFGFFWRKSGLLLYRQKFIFVNWIEVGEELQAALDWHTVLWQKRKSFWLSSVTAHLIDVEQIKQSLSNLQLQCFLPNT